MVLVVGVVGMAEVGGEVIWADGGGSGMMMLIMLLLMRMMLGVGAIDNMAQPSRAFRDDVVTINHGWGDIVHLCGRFKWVGLG